ncbi:homeodomain mating type protein alpha2 [Neodidymelliopsis sp. IMI 364377]|nr:homeodomain mating type protein alpha2 [Neodidymelliopsis sp. IMI 364377]
MADAHDNLDEFFDFAQLEQDSAAYGDWFQTQDAGSILSDHVTPMDWQPVVAAVTTSPSQMLQDEYTQHAATQHFGNKCPQQRSLFGMVNQSSTIAGPTSVGPAWLTPHVPTTEPQQHNELLTAPPSPFHAHEQSNLTNENINGILPILANNDPSEVLDKPIADTPFVQASHAHVSSPKPARASLPTRDASSASWKPASAKRKGPQSRIPLESRQILEDEFATNPYPLPWELDIIAHQANLEVKKVRNWFNNTRARKKGEDSDVVSMGNVCKNKNNLKSRLSHESLEALDQQEDAAVEPPQPPLALYLAQSYQEEAVELSDVQAALDSGSLSGSGYSDRGTWSTSRRGSAVGSIVSSEGTAPTAYTVSSNGSRSNVSSFGRDRRRGRRRMTWKESPHTRSINGVNSAGQPQKDLPFFCTFCPRAFKTKYEWIRHEDSVHALRTTWICCDAKSESLQSCPFCGQMHPDDAHMATHKYQQCRSKPESQRTFYRRDHFVQHLHHVHFANAKHPSVRVGCQARLMAAEGQHFGCKDLSMKWRRFGAPMKKDDPMLHCGFCGKKSKDWPERCEHVAEHLVARELNRSVWWPERRENHLENLSCNQEFYESEDAFLQHLHNFHGASQPALLRGSAIIEQTFMRNKGASFEPVEFNESMQPCHMDLNNTSITPFVTEKPIFSVSVSDRKPSKQIKKSAPVRKQIINTQSGQPSEPSRARANTVTTKAESHEPRFFRLSTYVPFVSSRIFYSRHSRSTELPRDHQAVFEEVPKPHLTSLVMSAGLVSMAVARWTVKPEKRLKDGMVELVLEEGVE